MQLLQITSKPPFPEIDGGCKAMAAITNGLIEQTHTVQLICLTTRKHPFIISSFPLSLKEKVKYVIINTKPSVFKAIYHLLINKSYNIFRFDNLKMHNLLSSVLQNNKYDAIILDSLYVTTYVDTIRNHSSAPIIYRAHNIEHEIWKENYKKEKNILRKKYIQILYKQLEKYEYKLLKKVDGIACISPENAVQIKNISKNYKVSFIPYTPNISKQNFTSYSKKLFFIGSFEWEPNTFGLQWFINNVWNKLQEFDSTIEFHIAGKGMVKNEWTGKNIYNYGEVENAETFINPFFIMPVPLFHGSGVRIKIIEAMALGKIVIATSKAAEGIPYTNKKNILIADNEEEFLLQIKYCITNKQEAEKISTEAQNFVSMQYNSNNVIQDLISFINGLKENE
jgi:glycosyltransferase involved in cell wall biosynthesis